MIYSQICVNFKIIGKNGDNWVEEEYTKLKREGWNTPTCIPNTHQSCPNMQKSCLTTREARSSELYLA